MNRYFGLLNKIAEEYNIQRGHHENETDWKARILYSYLALVGYASLYDIQDDLSPNSIDHFKKTIITTAESMLAMYPELKSTFLDGGTSLADELFTIFQETGCVYHKPYRLSPCMRKVVCGKKCTFYRGQALDEKRWLSGAGSFLAIKELKNKETKVETLSDMFSLPQQALITCWKNIVSKAEFTPLATVSDFKYLRTVSPFDNEDWVDRPDETGNEAIARTKVSGKEIYYLYKYTDDGLLISQLPGWQTEKDQYRNLAVAYLAFREKLPPTVFHIDGPIVTLKIGYPYPPAELNLIKLYSWPTVFYDLPHNFNRIMNHKVFNELRTYFEERGYQFKEE